MERVGPTPVCRACSRWNASDQPQFVVRVRVVAVGVILSSSYAAGSTHAHSWYGTCCPPTCTINNIIVINGAPRSGWSREQQHHLASAHSIAYISPTATSRACYQVGCRRTSLRRTHPHTRKGRWWRGRRRRGRWWRGRWRRRWRGRGPMAADGRCTLVNLLEPVHVHTWLRSFEVPNAAGEACCC